MKPIKKKWHVGFIMGKTGAKVISKMNTFFPKIECWTPTYRKQIFEGGNVEVKTELLLDNYIFLKMPENSFELQREIIQKTPIVYFLKDSEGQAFFLTESDVIHLNCLRYLTIVPERDVFVGAEVEVRKGVYQGYTGMCVEIFGGFATVAINLHDIQIRNIRFNISDIKLINSVGEIDIMPEMGEFNGNKKR